MILIKSDYDIAQIKKACAIWKQAKQAVLEFAKVGTSLKDIEKLVKKIIEKDDGAICAFKDYNGFMGEICMSVNSTVVHGVPSEYIIKKGDIVSFDMGVNYNGYICDAAFTMTFDCDSETEKMNEVCKQSLYEGIKQAVNGNRVGDISNAIQTYVESNGFEILRNFGGHGCGIKLHEDPMILNYGKPGTGSKLVPGMVICIEPMVLIGSHEYFIDKDGWSVKSVNNKNTSHWEHMVLIKEDGNEILTED